MKYKKLYCSLSIVIAALLFTISFKPSENKETDTMKVLIVTDFGVIKIKLYNETPLHRDNFIKLVREHYYDSLLFHRIIQNFAIQGGASDSKNAVPLAKIGNDGSNYSIPAETNQHLFHKKGALSAAGINETENLSNASSASQFFIVLGTVYTEPMLQKTALRITKTKLFNEIINRTENKLLLDKFQQFSESQQLDSIKTINEFIMKQVERELPNIKPYTFSAEQIKAYTSIGGVPHLDEGYTVFGEVIEGLAVIDDIAKEPVDRNGRPLTDIKMKISLIQ